MRFEVVHDIQEGYAKDIESMVEALVQELDIDVDKDGYRQSVIEHIAGATYLRVPGLEFWLAWDGDAVVGFVTASIAKAVDNRLAYHLHSGWFSKPYRSTGFTKACWESVKAQARRRLCKHVILMSARSGEAFSRFLGREAEPYLELLKAKL